MTGFFESFHFLRPGWFLLLLPAAWIAWRLIRASNPRTAYRDEIPDHLLKHLVSPPRERPRLRPLPVLFVLWILGIIALAGPAWRKQAAESGQETAGLVIVFKVTRSMESSDLPPSRLERARIKIRDLLAKRRDSPTGLVAYAGSAHLVMPMTADTGIIEHMMEALDPAVMPEDGDRLDEALELARQALKEHEGGGSILIVTDRISEDQVARLTAQSGTQILGIASDAGELNEGARKLDAPLEMIAPDDRDITRIEQRAATNLSDVSLGQTRWRDDGFLLIPLITIGLLFWSRKGWTL